MSHTESFDREAQASSYTDYRGLPADVSRRPDSPEGDAGRSDAPSSGHSPEPPTTTKKSKTALLADRFEEAARELEADDAKRLLFHAKQLDRCAEVRCGRPECPRCAGRRARRYRARLEKMIKARRPFAPHGFALLTLTVAAANAESGYRTLVDAAAKLRRRKLFHDSFHGGELHVQVEPSQSADPRARWNAHIHGIVELGGEFCDVQVSQLAEIWSGILRAGGYVGSIDVSQRQNLRASKVKRVHS